MKEFKLIEFSLDNGIASITLNRPEAGNAFNLLLATELNEAVNACQYDPNVRVVLLQAQGKLFCAGGDLASMAEAGDQVDAALKALTDQLHGAYSTMMRMRAPVIAVINGAAAGIGMSLALVADMTLASDKASFLMAYTAAGLSPDGGSTYLLPKVIGIKRAKEMMLTNRKLSAQEALDWGVINKVVAHENLQEEAQALAKSLAKGATNAFGSVKSLLLAADTQSLEGQLALESAAIAENAKGIDGQAGIHAFLNKQKPEFSGQ